MSFRGDAPASNYGAQLRPENLEIPGLVRSHHPGMTGMG
jgi:hypothetical protein